MPSIEVRTCESWWVCDGATYQPSGRSSARQRTAVVRPMRPGRSTAAVAVVRRCARVRGRAARRSPPRRTGGRRRSPTPGCRAARSTSVPSSATKKQIWPPGRRLTRPKISRAPSAASAGRTWSCGPTETPPTVTRMSAPRQRRAHRRRSSRSRSSPTRTREMTSAPASRAAALQRVAVGVADLAGLQRAARIDQLVAGADERDPRLAHDRRARDVDRREHADLRSGQQRAGLQHDRADGDVVAGDAHVVARGRRPPRSSPCRCRCSSAPGARRRRRRRGSARRSRRGSPCPGCDLRAGAGPGARLVDDLQARRARRVVSLARSAKPSIVEQSNGGTGFGATASCASTRPSASSRSTCSAPSVAVCSSTWRRASSIEIRCIAAPR